ncbi:MAG: DUF3467 domain-containing protein [Patescibacteria group bacterium]
MTDEKQPNQGGQPAQSGPVRPQEIKVADNIPGAEYANAMQVNHNKDEIQMMFLSIMGISGRVVGKVMTSPGHYKRMIAAMTDNLKKYEERFGEVKEAEGPESKEIGFKG